MLPMRPGVFQRTSLFWAAVSGTSTKSSWSLPICDCPLPVKTPTILNGILFILNIFPTGFSPWNILSAIVLPITAILAPCLTSLSFMSLPDETCQSWTYEKFSVLPVTFVLQFVFP